MAIASIELAGLKIAGVSGIYKPDLFKLNQRVSVREISSNSNTEYSVSHSYKVQVKLWFLLIVDWMYFMSSGIARYWFHRIRNIPSNRLLTS